MSSLRRAISAGIVALLPIVTAAVAILPATPAHASASLREHAAARGKFIGTALATSPLANETAYRNLAATEFNQVTAENAMKWDATEPSQDQFNWSGADAIVNFAARTTSRCAGTRWSGTTRRRTGRRRHLSRRPSASAILQNHIAQVAGRTPPTPALAWDVVNEVFNETAPTVTRSGTNARRPLHRRMPAGPRGRPIPTPDSTSTTTTSRASTPRAPRCTTWSRTLKAQDVPIDGVGFQGHLATQYGFPGQVQQNLQRFADLGVDVAFTELDIR